MSERVTVELLDEASFPVRVARKGETWAKSVAMSGGEMTTVYRAGVAGDRRYTFVVRDSTGKELFFRTFTVMDLNDRQWQVIVTGAGLQ